MKIIFLGKYNTTETLAGPEKVGKRLFECLKDNNNAYFIEYFFSDITTGILPKLFGNQKIEERVLRLGIIRLLTFLYKYKPDVIHIITFQRFVITVYLYKLFSRVRIFYTVHGVIKYENSIRNKISLGYKWKDYIIEKIILSLSDKLLFLSQESVKMMNKYYKIASHKIEIIPNGVDGIFNKQQKINNIENVLKIVFTGDIDRKEKEFYFLYSVLNSMDIAISLTVISDTREFNYPVSNLKLKVHYYRKMPTEIYAELLKDKDLIISTSSYEPFSISTLEGMAAGLIPIVTNIAGIARYIDNGYNGFIFTAGDSEALQKIILDINNNPEIRARVSDNARKIYSELKWENIAEKHTKMYQLSLNEQENL